MIPGASNVVNTGGVTTLGSFMNTNGGDLCDEMGRKIMVLHNVTG